MFLNSKIGCVMGQHLLCCTGKVTLLKGLIISSVIKQEGQNAQQNYLTQVSDTNTLSLSPFSEKGNY